MIYISRAKFKNPSVNAFIKQAQELFLPDQVYICDGSSEEDRWLKNKLVACGQLTPLNPKTFSDCFWTRSNPNDVARVEKFTVICSKDPGDAGPTNIHKDPTEMKKILGTLSAGGMKGRTMFVIPYCMGPIASKYSQVGVMVTDSEYVVINMNIMARVGQAVLDKLGASSDFVRGLHSVLDCNPERRWIAHFPEEDLIWSVGSGYGGNALLGKKCHALRIGSTRARRQGWMAEHMLIIKVKRPDGRAMYGTAAFPSACGKTNMAMLIPPAAYRQAGWEVTTIGDDIAWLNMGSDGRLYAINPEAGFFGVMSGTSEKTNPNFMHAVHRSSVLTNTAFNPDTREPWWEGMTDHDVYPPGLIDWRGNTYEIKKDENGKIIPAAHPNARGTVPAENCPSIDPQWDDPNGVPIDFILFGGRRTSGAPLVVQGRTWNEGVWLGATMSSEQTAAAEGKVGSLRFDPMAMLPFCGYHICDYFQHWLDMGKRLGDKAPKIFRINSFRKRGNSFLWPGFGENIRVLEWVFKRCMNEIDATESELGYMPRTTDINTEDLKLQPGVMEEMLNLDPDMLWDEMRQVDAQLLKFVSKLPAGLKEVHEQIKEHVAARVA